MELPSWIDTEAWDGFVEMRKSIKKPLTKRAMVLAIHKLERLLKEGYDPTAVLDQSTFNSWQGLFPLKDGGFNGQSSKSIGGTGRNFAEERDKQRRERDARILARSNPLARDIHREDPLRIGNIPLGGEAIEVPEMEVERDPGLYGTAYK